MQLARKLTKTHIEKLQPGDSIWDGELRGFGARCQLKTKSFFLKYSFKGRQRWLTIGKYGSPWTVDKARTEATRLLGVLASGIDPATARDQANKDITIAELCNLYLAEGCSTKKASTIATDTGRIERHIKPLLGKRRCRDITRSDIEKMMLHIANGKTATDVRTGARGRAIVKGGKGTATKAVNLLGAIFVFAKGRAIVDENPTEGVKTYKSNSRERFLSPAELSRLGETLREMEREGRNQSGINAIRLLALTGCRKSEVLSLRWDQVDLNNKRIRFDDSKTGAKSVTIGAAAAKLLSDLSEQKQGQFVFPSNRDDGHFVGLAKIWQKVREKSDLPNVRIHDLRHSYASVGAASGDSLYIIGKLLGHKQAGTTARYAHLADDPLVGAADRIAGRISAAMASDHNLNAITSKNS